MAKRPSRKEIFCSVESTLDVLSGRWKVLVLQKLFSGPIRYGALKRALKGITPRTLSMQLRELERDGLIVRTVVPARPPEVSYSLSGRGRSLEPVLEAMHRWGESQS